MADGRPRVLIVSSFWPDSEADSYGSFVYDQTEAVVAAGGEVTVVVPRPLGIHRRSRRGARPMVGATVRTAAYFAPPVRAPLTRWSLARIATNASAALRRALAGIGADFDAVHLHSLSPEGLTLPRWRDAVSARRTLMTVHGLDPRFFPIAGADTSPPSLERVWSVYDRIIAVGHPILPALRASGAPAEKLGVVPNGARIPAEGEWSARQGQTPGRRVVLSVSNLVALKGIDLNIRALAELGQRLAGLDWEYQIIGSGPDEAKLRALAARCGVAERVLFRGRLSYSETMREMSRADIFSLPSWGEAFGIVYPEAMGRGRPVIGCKGWGAAETVRDGIDGLLVEPCDAAGLSVALSRLLVDPDYCESLGRAGRERAKSFSWQANQRAYFPFYID